MRAPPRDNPVDNPHWLPIHLVDHGMDQQKIICPFCMNQLKFGETYGVIPCGSAVPHHGHYLEVQQYLRSRNDCPSCRKIIKFERPPEWLD